MYPTSIFTHAVRFDLLGSMRKGIASSKIVLACLNETYQTRENCMFELREAHQRHPDKIITMLTG